MAPGANMQAQLQATEQRLLADLVPRFEGSGETILDVGPARLDKNSQERIPIEPGILLMSDRCLYFRGQQHLLRMNWLMIAEMVRKPRLAGAKLTIRMEAGNWSRFYLGKVYSEQIVQFFNVFKFAGGPGEPFEE